jgi:hypothetical protein
VSLLDVKHMLDLGETNSFEELQENRNVQDNDATSMDQKGNDMRNSLREYERATE